MSANKRVVEQINRQIGKNLKGDEKIMLVHEAYVQRLEDILPKLNYESSEYDAFKLNEFETCTARLIEVREQCARWQDDYNKMLSTSMAETFHELKQDVPIMQSLQTLLRFLISMQEMYETHENLKVALKSQDNEAMLHFYLKLYEKEDPIFFPISNVKPQDSPCLHAYAQELACAWYNRIKNSYSEEMKHIMETLRINNEDQVLNIKYDDTNLELIHKVQSLANLLFTLQPPTNDLVPSLTIIEPGIICQPISDVVSVLLEPYRKRFKYDFSGKRKTNRLDKPEWMYTQLINWAKNGTLFMVETFQQCAIEAGKLNCNVKLEFLQGLMMLAMQKICSDLDEIVRDQILFAHLVDETLSFEAEMRDLFGYPDTFPSVISVLSSPKYLNKWLSLEEDFCERMLDAILNDKDAWTILEMPGESGVKIPRCVDRFMRLLDGIRGRYFTLIQPGQKLQFLSVQMMAIDSFRRRIVQLYNSYLLSASSVLNAVNYLAMVLHDWNENVHYLHLNVALIGADNENIGSVFDTVISELELWRDTMLKTYAANVFSTLRSKASAYVTDSWYDMPEQDSQTMMVSPTSFELFQNLASTLNSLHTDISEKMFNEIVRYISSQLDDLIFEELMISMDFSPGGVQQFEFDMTRNLFTLFGHYLNAPELLFKKIHNGLILLTASKGTALLMLKTFKCNDIEQKKSVLKDLNIQFLDIETCIKLLERRIDIFSPTDAAKFDF